MPLSTPFVCLLTWIQREIWRLILDTPEALSGFTITLKFLYSAGFSGDTGTRIFWEKCESTAAVEKRIHEKSSETLVMDIVAQEMTRVNCFIEKLGFLNPVIHAL